MKPYIIIRKIQDTTLWPSQAAVEIEVQYPTVSGPSATGKTTILKEEYELRMYIQTTKTDYVDFDKLWDMIEEYGQAKYTEGSTNAEISASENME